MDGKVVCLLFFARCELSLRLPLHESPTSNGFGHVQCVCMCACGDVRRCVRGGVWSVGAWVCGCGCLGVWVLLCLLARLLACLLAWLFACLLACLVGCLVGVCVCVCSGVSVCFKSRMACGRQHEIQRKTNQELTNARAEPKTSSDVWFYQDSFDKDVRKVDICD